MFDLFAAIGFPVYAACDIADWPEFSKVITDTQLWKLAIAAQNEIASLPRYGWIGKLSALLMRPKVMANVHLKMEREMLPLDLQAFNRFHHGGKVRTQDMDSLRDSLADGRRAGRKMSALAELLRLAEEHEIVLREAAGPIVRSTAR